VFLPLGCHDPGIDVSLPSKTGRRGTLERWSPGGAGRAGDLPFSRRASRSPDPDSRLLAPPHRAANSALLAGKDLLHLQCHFGLDTLSWARRAARVTGADFSERAVAQARLLAAETGLAARFVVSDVVDLPDRLEGDFDVVFTSFGVLDRLPDVPRWAEVVAHFVRPGRLLLHRRGPPVRLGLRRRRRRHRAAPPRPLLAVGGAAGVPGHRVLRRPGRPGRGRAGDLAAPEPDDARLPLLYSLKATKA
jgi:SAM-dependent methyltransferase